MTAAVIVMVMMVVVVMVGQVADGRCRVLSAKITLSAQG
jgi:hypothetical protein